LASVKTSVIVAKSPKVPLDMKRVETHLTCGPCRR